MGRKSYTKKNPRPLTQKEQWKKGKRNRKRKKRKEAAKEYDKNGNATSTHN